MADATPEASPVGVEAPAGVVDATPGLPPADAAPVAAKSDGDSAAPAGDGPAAAPAVVDYGESLSRDQLAAMSSKPVDFRKKLASPEAKKAAVERQAAEAKRHMIHDDDTGALIPWTSASIATIGHATQSMGIELYFTFLKNGAFLFAGWAALTLFTILGCLADSGAADDSVGVTGLAVFSLASFGNAEERVDGLLPEARTVDLYGESYDAYDVTPWMSAMSAFGAFLYFVYVLHFAHVRIARGLAKREETEVTPSNFTVLVEDLPALDAISFPREEYEIELKKHFWRVLQEEKFLKAEDERTLEKGEKKKELPVFERCPGDVAELNKVIPEISFARDYGGRLAQVAAEAKLKERVVHAKLDEDAKQLEGLTREATKLLERKQKRKGKYDSLTEAELGIFRVYVSFDKAQDAGLVKNGYRFSSGFFGYYLQGERLRFNKKRITVSEAPDPSNILWENQDCPLNERRVREMMVRLLVLVLLGVSTAGILWAQQKQKTETDKAAGMGCADTVTFARLNQPAVEVTPLAASTYLDSTFGAGGPPANFFSDCECSAIGTSNMQGSLLTACEDFYDKQQTMLLITSASALVVVILNAVLKFGLTALAHVERPLTLSGLETSIATKVFVALFLNTALLVFLLNQKWFPPFDEVLKGDKQDFDHQWFATVGLAIATTLMINIASPHLIAVGVSYVLRLKQYLLGACCASTEEALASAYDPPEFELAPRAGALLNTLFSTLVFAAGCPILIWFAALNHALCYLCDKFLLFRVSKRPPAYDEAVMYDSLLLIPFAMLAHAVVGIWMLGNPDVFPSGEIIEDVNVDDELSPLFKPVLTMIARACRGSGFPYFLLFLAVLFYLALRLLKMLLGNAFKKVAKCLLGGVAKCLGLFTGGKKNATLAALDAMHNIVRAQDQTTYTQAQAEWREHAKVASYLMTANEKYAFMKTADVDLEAFAKAGVVRHMPPQEERAQEKEQENKAEAGAVAGAKVAGGGEAAVDVEQIIVEEKGEDVAAAGEGDEMHDEKRAEEDDAEHVEV